MILEEMFNGRFYPCETVVADSLRFKQATKASAALMDTLSEHLSKEDYALVEELREQMAIAQCEENESHFKRKPMSKWRREKKSSIPIVAVLILSTATLLP